MSLTENGSAGQDKQPPRVYTTLCNQITNLSLLLTYKCWCAFSECITQVHSLDLLELCHRQWHRNRASSHEEKLSFRSGNTLPTAYKEEKNLEINFHVKYQRAKLGGQTDKQFFLKFRVICQSLHQVAISLIALLRILWSPSFFISLYITESSPNSPMSKFPVKSFMKKKRRGNKVEACGILQNTQPYFSGSMTLVYANSHTENAQPSLQLYFPQKCSFFFSM